MSTQEDLRASIAEYTAQFNQVELALKSCTTDAERNSLENLKSDLKELLDLTHETLNEQDEASAGSSSTKPSSYDVKDPFAEEMDRFMSELKKTEEMVAASNRKSNDLHEKMKTVKSANRNGDGKIMRIKKRLKEIIGTKCQAPHMHAWGGRAYHNALICGLDETTNYEMMEDNNDDNDIEIHLENIKLKILFTNPTHREMLPCSYYLDGDCRFEADKCRFSHGELVLYSEIKEYKEPDFSLLQKSKYPVLAKQKDRIWHKGQIVSSNFTEKICKIKLDHSKKEISCDFEDIFPLVGSDNSHESSSDSETTSDEEDEYGAMHKAYLIEKSLLTPAADQPLGEWERYTKGFGSKMMQKFGYVLGTGLGQNGEGIIVPISAQILPPGRSLDHCMELREQANGDKDLFSVERKLKQRKQKQEQQNVNAYERERKKTNVFNFINENIFANDVTDVSHQQQQSTSTSLITTATTPRKLDFKNHSNKNLNVAGLQISEEIRRKERDIQKVKESMTRHKIGTPVHNKLAAQLNFKNTELLNLKKSETNVAKEQIFRKDKSKLTIF